MFKERIDKQNNDKGFSLVELIIVVSILAIAAIPLMRSMGMASRANAKAQSIQNATSLAESIMEEMKSTPIDELKTKYSADFSGGVMSFQMTGDDGKGIPVNQGERYIATVTINTNSYSAEPTLPPEHAPLSEEQKKVYKINSTKLPVIEEIDTNTQAVLTSEKEFNRYDKAAQTYFDERKAGFKSGDPSTYSKITEKTVTIKKKNAPALGGYSGVTVTAIVSYKGDGETEPYVRDLYTGTFVAEPDAEGHVALDSNIYIFYKVGKTRNVSGGLVSEVALPETIKIEDSSTPSVETSTDSHRVYFIRQESSDTVGPKLIEFSGAGTGKFQYSPLPADTSTKGISDLTDGRIEFGNIIFATNLDPSGYIFSQEARNRVYDISVVLTKPDDSTVYATLNSTVTASDK